VQYNFIHLEFTLVTHVRKMEENDRGYQNI